MKSERKATVKDVAEKAGVSTATVSRVLNGDARVKPDTVLLVNRTIEELGYRMNRVARSLKTSRTHTIGVIAPEFRNEFFMNIVTGIEEELKKKGYSVILCSSRERREEETELIGMLRDKGVDGIILIPGSSEGEHLNSVLPLPLVLVDRTVDGYPCDAVVGDNYRGAYNAVGMALGEGARRIGFIGGDMNLSTARERFGGYGAALREKGLTARNGDILFGDYHEESGYRLMGELMGREDPPDYVFIANYFMHLGAARYLLEQKSPFPGLHILSFDDMPLASFFPYSSIIVAQPMEEMGRRAAELLLTRVEKKSEEKDHRVIRLETTLRKVL
jgi:LacI family transcriptional regulator